MKTKRSFLPLRLAAATVLTLLFVFSLVTNATDPYTLTYTLTYSEGNTTLGDGTVSAMETSDTTMSINLTSPVGAATERYFTTSSDITTDKWVIDNICMTNGAASVSQVPESRTYKVSIPENAAGTATLTVNDEYTITFTVTDSVVGSNVVKPGETFNADGIEWRVLMQDGNSSLVIAEHVIETRQFHNQTVYPTWANSTIKTYLNGTFLPGLTTLSSKAIEKNDIMTMSKAYQNTEGGKGAYEASTDKIFLLSIEEVYYTGTDDTPVKNGATVSTAANRTNGDTVIFADAHARKSTAFPNLTGTNTYPGYWRLRSPNWRNEKDLSCEVENSSGDPMLGTVTVPHGIRPALWLNLESPLLSESSLLTVNGGSGGGYYTANTVVSIAANTTPGQTFINWTKSGEDGAFANDAAPFTTFTMPTSESTVTANSRWNTPNIGIDYANETLTGLVAGGTYTFGASESVPVSETTYQISEDWMTGSELSITRKAEGNVSDSTALSLAIPARPAAPDQPAVNGTPSATSITLNPITGAQYAIKSIGGTEQNELSWQDSATFDTLTPNTAYAFVARIKTTGAAFASPPSTASDAIAAAKAALTGTVTITGTPIYGETLTAETSTLTSTPTTDMGTLSYQWKRGEAEIDSATEAKYPLATADVGQTITVTVTAENCLGDKTSDPTEAVATVLDFSALEAKLAEAKAIERGNYITSTWAALQEAITGAEKTLEPEAQHVTQEAIDDALAALTSAIDGLRHIYIYIPPPENNNNKNDDADEPTETPERPAATPEDDPFDDVGQNDWFYDDVMFAYSRGLMTGTSARKFSPDAPMARGMIVTVLHRMESEPAARGATTFSDVVSGKYYTEAVAWAEGEGIVDGYGNGLFGPEDDITRQDLALLFLRCARYKGVKLPEIRAYADFDDDKDVSGYAQEATETMYKAGIISGKPGNRLDPKGTATRAEVAAMLRRFLESVQQ